MVGIGGGFFYIGQWVLVEGEIFVNMLFDYDFMNCGWFVGDDVFVFYLMCFDLFDVIYQLFGEFGFGQVGDFFVNVMVQENGEECIGVVKVNEFFVVVDDDVFLFGNGYVLIVIV